MKQATVELVVETFKARFSELGEDARKTFRQRFIVHDYETFPNDTHLTMLDIMTGHVRSLWGVDQIREQLRRVFLRDDSTVLVGFNNKNFDNKITDAILAGANEQAVKRLSDELIAQGSLFDAPWRSSESGRGRPDWVGRTFDIGFDIGQRKIGDPPNERKIPEIGLKRWMRLNGYEVMHSTVPFDKPDLTRADRRETERYCLNDNCGTALLLLSNDKNADACWDSCLNARRVLVDDYGHKGVNWEMTKPRITAIVLNAKEENFTVPEDWENTRYVVPREIRIWKHRDILRAYSEKTLGELRAMSSRKAGGTGVVNKDVCGVPHLYGIGGVHGCPKGVWSLMDGGIWSLDAASLYPNIMRHYGFLSRRVIGDDRALFGQLIDLRTNVYKPRGDKRADGLKLVLNGGFGSMGFEKSEMYDPVSFCGVTITGQLLMTDLLEKLERRIELIQSNTDGIFFRLVERTDAAMAEVREIVKAFERRTHLEMEWTEFEKMYQRDISNYVAREVPKPGKPAGSGKVKTKGTWYNVKHCSVTPYLYEARVHAALNQGAVLSPTGISMERFAIELKRDKNSECFAVDGKMDAREWLDVVPVVPNSRKAQNIGVVCKDDGKMAGGLFGDDPDDLAFRKRRKATGCPAYAALAENVTVEDIDLKWYAAHKPPFMGVTDDTSVDLFD